MRAAALPGLLCAALTGCSGGSETGRAEVGAPPAPEVVVRSAIVKRSPSGQLITALRGTATPGATITVGGRSTQTSADGAWALRTSYDRSRAHITVRVSGSALGDGSVEVAQPHRPKLTVTRSTGDITTADETMLKGRVRIDRGSIRGVRVTVNGMPALVSGTRWTKRVVVRKGTRRFTVRATKPGADGGRLTMTKTRKLSAAERRARAAKRAAARQARIAEREAKRAAQAAAESAAGGDSACDPNYSGACLDPNASDYDCAGGSGNGPEYVQGPVQVVGSDPFDLDRDGDGVGCE